MEAWLSAVEGGMQQSLRKLLRSIVRALPSQVSPVHLLLVSALSGLFLTADNPAGLRQACARG